MAELSLNARTMRHYKSNKEYLEKSIDNFLDKYDELCLMTDKVKAQEKYQEYCLDENFKLMNTLYNSYFDENRRDLLTMVNLSNCYDIKDYDELERTVVDSLKCRTFEGLIAPNGDYYPAVKSHYCLCTWLNLNGVDIRGFIRATCGVNRKLTFSDLTNYTDMDKDVHFNLTEEQVKAAYTLLKLYTKGSENFSFHDTVEESFKHGFCKFSDTEKTRKQIGLFEDVLGKRIVNSNEILSSRTKYY